MTSSSRNVGFEPQDLELVRVHGCVFELEDHEVVHYLNGKKNGCTDGLDFRFVKDKNVYEYEPSQLQGFAENSGTEKMYFFTNLRKKDGGKSVNRQVQCKISNETGFWQKTGDNNKDKELVVIKTSLAYYKYENSKRVKTQWLMKEYMFREVANSKNPLALCVVYKLPSRE